MKLLCFIILTFFISLVVSAPSETIDPEDDIFTVNEKLGVLDELVNGDIKIENTRQKRQIASNAARWPRIIPYMFHSNISGTHGQEAVEGAIKIIEAHTCLKFQKQNLTNRGIRFTYRNGCWANIGMVGHRYQDVSVGYGCDNIGSAAHEIMHVLGFFHTQDRFDRDDYITLDESILPVSLGWKQKDTFFTTPYDYGSVMHYSAGVSAGKPDNYVAKDPRFRRTMGAKLISTLDLIAINRHYQCTCPVQLPCKNEGYTNPSNCNECNCPYGYGGKLCDERPNTECGRILEASKEWKTENYTFGNPGKYRRDIIYCNHWITAPKNKKIEFKILSISKNVACSNYWNGIEPRVDANLTMTHPRYSCPEHTNITWETRNNPLAVMTYNIDSVVSYSFAYRYVRDPCVDTEPYICQFNLKYLQKPLQKLLCAKTLGLCGKVVSNCDEPDPRFCKSFNCSRYDPLSAEYNCPKKCGYCENPV